MQFNLKKARLNLYKSIALYPFPPNHLQIPLTPFARSPTPAPGQSAAAGRRRIGQVHLPQADAHHTRRQLRAGTGARVPARHLPESDTRHAGAGGRAPEAGHRVAQRRPAEARRPAAAVRRPGRAGCENVPRECVGAARTVGRRSGARGLRSPERVSDREWPETML